MKLNIKTKIILAVLIPLAGLLYFVTIGMVEKFQLISKVNDLVVLSNLSINTSSVVHELQRERGRTGGFMGSNGEKFINELFEQRALTDSRIRNLDAFLKNLIIDRFDNELAVRLNISLQKLDILKEHRENIDNLTISNSDGINFYTELNASMLDVVAYIPKLGPNAEISALLSGYVNFIRGKENAGIERAVGSIAFAEDKFDLDLYDYFTSLIVAQKTYFSSFEFFATEEQLDFFRENTSRPIFAEVQKLRDILIEKRIEGGFEIDTTVWFDNMTIKIDILKEIEDKISDDLRLQARAVDTKARNDLILFSIIVSIIMLLTIILFISLLLIIKPIIRARDVAIEISRGNMDVKIDTSGTDEIAELSRAVNKMRESLKVILEEYESRTK